VAAYEAFTALFGQSSYAPRARSLLERRREMLAWEVAVATNTAASFETFLASYASSDLAATARKMQMRVFNRTLAASASLAPIPVALGPTCPCPAQPAQPLIKKVEPPPSTRRVDAPPPKRKRPRGGDDDVVVERGPPGPPPGVIVESIGMGVIGLGGGMRGGGMGGMGGGYGNRR
jgi:hypothetical protein